MGAPVDAGVLLVLRGQVEEDLVRALATEPGLAVVRRCADLAELTAAVIAGLGSVAVVDADLGVDRTLVQRLRSHGTRTVVRCGADEVARFDALGAFGLARGVDVIPAIRSLADGDDAERVVDLLETAEAEPGAADVVPVQDGPGRPGPAERRGDDGADAEAAGAGPGPDLAAGEAAPPGTEASPPGSALPGSALPGRALAGGALAGGARPESAAAPAAEPDLRSRRVHRRRDRRRARGRDPGSDRRRDRRSADAAFESGAGPALELPPRLIAVTGAAGAPGRSTIAINLAQELAHRGAPVMLIDADLWGGAIAQTLGLLAETAGLSAAVRAADHGTLDAGTLARLAPRVGANLRVLPGLARASRWREVSAASIEALLHTARQTCPWVVVEVPVLVPEEDAGYGLGPGRNDVARGVLGAADEIVVVGAAEPIGIERLVQALLDLDDVPTGATRRVAVNRLRTSAAGPRAGDSVREALARFAAVTDPVVVPDDRATCDRALLAGTTWRESGARSPARAAVTELAGDLLAAAGVSAPVERRGPGRWLPGPTRRPGRAAAH